MVFEKVFILYTIMGQKLININSELRYIENTTSIVLNHELMMINGNLYDIILR